MSSRRRTTTSTITGTATATANQLGDLSFDDWYETPVFEAEPDERLEQLATSKRAPMRLVAGAMLRLAPAGASPAGALPAATPEPADGASRDEPATLAAPPADPFGPAATWRERAGRVLDRWADVEIASQARLERIVLPKRWRG